MTKEGMIEVSQTDLVNILKDAYADGHLSGFGSNLKAVTSLQAIEAKKHGVVRFMSYMLTHHRYLVVDEIGAMSVPERAIEETGGVKR